MVRVAIISPCMGKYGGLEGFVLALARALGSEPALSVDLVFKQTTGFQEGDDLKLRIAESGVRARFCQKAGRELWRTIAGADVIHVQNPCPDVVWMAGVMRKPILINVINHSRGGRSLHERLWRLCLRLGQQRFYISDFVRRTWEQSEQPWRNSRVVFPICDLAPLEPLPADRRKGFVFISRWIENKGLDILLEAYARTGLDPERWPLRLLGDGPLRPRIVARAKELRLHQVEMPGFTSEQEKWEAIRSSRFAVIPPNTREDFGLVAIEARHLGVPCIISCDGGVPEAAGIHSMSCEPGNVDDLARVLQEAARLSPEDYELLARNAQQSLKSELVTPSFYRVQYLDLANRRRGRNDP